MSMEFCQATECPECPECGQGHRMSTKCGQPMERPWSVAKPTKCYQVHVMLPRSVSRPKECGQDYGVWPGPGSRARPMECGLVYKVWPGLWSVAPTPGAPRVMKHPNTHVINLRESNKSQQSWGKMLHIKIRVKKFFPVSRILYPVS